MTVDLVVLSGAQGAGKVLALAGLGLLTRYEPIGLPDRTHITDAVTVFWLFALGWAAARTRTLWQRLVVTVAGLATVPGTRRLNQLAGLLAGSSLAIYLTHWQIYPIFDQISQPLALAISLAFGVAYAWGTAVLIRRVPEFVESVRRGQAALHPRTRRSSRTGC
ncbi:hypothetical protein [Streptomyces fulvorobeus]|uniref:Acyltransferase n=1 Tax=Streptomyces fulvorobeus TaxID=284028 RepID=A0A7J0CH60_9ACTN|nr:hypothetical protein [Streptomyces fulvorobeus]NYE44711.1 hypothetical protein [Streptomyces fulvorobeus]GFN01264.1 hypothetical protein Sfulv_60740 [Streptomyces fulvorobeus]